MPADRAIQDFVYALKTGSLGLLLRRALAVVAIIALALFYLLHEFRGLATAQAMDQAQIGREIVRGHGWSTKFLRPLAVGELKRHGREVLPALNTDTYHAPIPPLVNAAALWLPERKGWHITKRDIVNSGDRAIALSAIVLFLMATGVFYLIAAELFDRRLALIACALIIVCDTFWQYSLSGLPQMLLLLLLHLTIYTLLRAMRARAVGCGVRRWLALAGLGFGLLALSHALTIWMFIPALGFCAWSFRADRGAAPLMLAIFAAVYLPWLVRNEVVSGNPFGLSIYSALDGVRTSESGIMRSADLDLSDVTPADFLRVFRANLLAQFDKLFRYLGWSWVAPVAFLTLLHPFRRRDTAAIRWLIFAMWIGAVIGMAVFGIHEEQEVAANQFHLLFIPLFTAYGLAFLLIQWSRLAEASLAGMHATRRSLEAAFIAALFILCALPLAFVLCFANGHWKVHWTPYFPSSIATIGEWLEPDEIVGSDMPWAVAWYADRRSVWLPDTVKKFTDMQDYDTLGGPIHGLYLTPVSGTDNTLADITHGEYQNWARFIVRTMNLKTFSLPWMTPLGQPDCTFFSNYDRRTGAGK